MMSNSGEIRGFSPDHASPSCGLSGGGLDAREPDWTRVAGGLRSGEWEATGSQTAERGVGAWECLFPG